MIVGKFMKCDWYREKGRFVSASESLQNWSDAFDNICFDVCIGCDTQVDPDRIAELACTRCVGKVNCIIAGSQYFSRRDADRFEERQSTLAPAQRDQSHFWEDSFRSGEHGRIVQRPHPLAEHHDRYPTSYGDL